MKLENKLLFACTRQNLLEEHQKTVQDICRHEVLNWDLVYSTAQEHGVAPLIYMNLQHCSDIDFGSLLSPEIKSKFEKSYYHNIARKSGQAVKLREILAFFNCLAIDIMLIKGGALDILVYDQPWYTRPNDIDLVIRVRREELATTDLAAIKSFFAKLSGFEYDFFEHHDVVMNGILPVNFQRIWDDAIPMTFRGGQVWVMSPEDMLISICINGCRKRFFRLKSLCDIAEILNRCPELDWAELIRKAGAYQCQYIVYTALLVTKMTLGCNLPDEVLDNLALSPIRASLIRYLSHSASSRSLPVLDSGKKVFGRQIDRSLLLPYATFRWNQLWQKISFVWKTEINGLPRRRRGGWNGWIRYHPTPSRW